MDEKRDPSPIDQIINDDSSSSEELFSNEIWPKSRKKVRQTKLLNQGFSKQTILRSSSPDPVYLPLSQDQTSWDSNASKETLDLEIEVETISFELKLHFRDLR